MRNLTAQIQEERCSVMFSDVKTASFYSSRTTRAFPLYLRRSYHSIAPSFRIVRLRNVKKSPQITGQETTEVERQPHLKTSHFTGNPGVEKEHNPSLLTLI